MEDQTSPLEPAILYAAKSSPDEKGSIPDQLMEARQWAGENGHQVIAEYSEEDISAYTDDRGPELAAALEHAESAGALLIAQHSDRLARGDAKQARHLVEIALWALKADVKIHCIQDPRTFASLQDAAVMGERNMEDSRRKANAIKAGHARRRKRGQFTGIAPNGYLHRRNAQDERQLFADPKRAWIIKRIYARYLAGFGLTEIVRELTGEGIKTRHGVRWSPTTVREILMNPVYAGLLRDGEELVTATHEPIIDRKTWEQAQALRKAKARTHKRGRPSAGKHLFRKGFLKCGMCGGSIVPTTDLRAKKDYEYYRCVERVLNADACTMPTIHRARVDDAVYAYFDGLGLDAEATKAQLAAAQEARLSEARDVFLASEREAQASQERLERIKGDYLRGELNATEWRELRGELEPEAQAASAEAGRLKGELEEIESESALAKITAELLEYLAEIRAAMATEIKDAEGAAAVRAVLLRLFEGFVLHQDSSQYETREGKKDRSWLEPVLSQLEIGAFEEKLSLTDTSKRLGEATNNFPLPEMRDMRGTDEPAHLSGAASSNRPDLSLSGSQAPFAHLRHERCLSLRCRQRGLRILQRLGRGRRGNQRAAGNCEGAGTVYGERAPEERGGRGRGRQRASGARQARLPLRASERFGMARAESGAGARSLRCPSRGGAPAGADRRDRKREHAFEALNRAAGPALEDPRRDRKGSR
jgi:DNA invertase Pin-like site-specific DNA recombinase